MTLVMGILNVTPDSFSDGGLFDNIDSAVAQAHQMVADGADIIDVGGESTRPFAAPVSQEEELSRVLPVIGELVRSGVKTISIDTRNSKTAQACLDAGASWLNDVSAFTYDPQMVAIAKHAAKVVLMHARGTPDVMQLGALTYNDIVNDIANYLRERVEFAVSHGIAKEKIIVDPGVGFGKTTQQDLRLIQSMKAFSGIGSAVMAGVSRKKFLGALSGIADAKSRDAITLGALSISVLSGADIVRVHNVKMAKEALRVVDAVKEMQA